MELARFRFHKQSTRVLESTRDYWDVVILVSCQRLTSSLLSSSVQLGGLKTGGTRTAAGAMCVCLQIWITEIGMSLVGLREDERKVRWCYHFHDFLCQIRCVLTPHSCSQRLDTTKEHGTLQLQAMDIVGCKFSLNHLQIKNEANWVLTFLVVILCRILPHFIG